MPLAIYMGMRAFGLEAEPRRHYESEGLLGSSLAGQRRRQPTTPEGYYPPTSIGKSITPNPELFGVTGVARWQHA